MRRLGTTVRCEYCRAEFYRRRSEPGRRFCSKHCFDDTRRRNEIQFRVCATCDKLFEYHDRPFSNSAGTYCSLACRNQGYRRQSHGPRHRPGWRSVRNRFVRANPFCCRCGVRDVRLDVHHVEPYRVGRDDRDQNLVVLCRPCHTLLEPLSSMLAGLAPERRALAVAMIQADLADLWHLHQGRRLLAC